MARQRVRVQAEPGPAVIDGQTAQSTPRIEEHSSKNTEKPLEEDDDRDLGSDGEPGVDIHQAESFGDDPVVSEHDVFMNDGVVEKLMLLQYPNRDSREPYTQANHAKPTELRSKPRAGIVEVDIPMEIFHNCDKEKAVRFGDALRKSTDARAGGALGLAGGFGIGATSGRAASSTGRGSKKGDGDAEPVVEHEMLLADFIGASNAGRVLNKQTLGGQISSTNEGKPIYMLGAFRDQQLHLTPMDSIAQLRPQFHHIDAMVEQEKTSLRAQRDAANPPRQQETRAVQMTVKSADGDDMDVAETATTLKAAQEESWTRLEFIDTNTPEAWDAYAKFYVENTADASRVQSSMLSGVFLAAISASTDEPNRTTKQSGGGKHVPIKTKG